MKEFSPNRAAHEKLMAQTMDVALLEDIMRSATAEEYKNLEHDDYPGSWKEVYRGTLGGHHINIAKEDKHPGLSEFVYTLSIDNGRADILSEPSLEARGCSKR